MYLLERKLKETVAAGIFTDNQAEAILLLVLFHDEDVDQVPEEIREASKELLAQEVEPEAAPG